MSHLLSSFNSMYCQNSFNYMMRHYETENSIKKLRIREPFKKNVEFSTLGLTPLHAQGL